MPRGIPKKKNPELYNDTPPPTPVISESEPVRPQIKQMTGFKSAEEMAASLPTDTMTSAPEEKPKRTYSRKPKQEEAPADPLLNDPRYRKAISGMQGFGGPKIVKGGFSAVALATSDPSISLSNEEGEQLEDFFYVLGKRYQALDPSGHWFTMMLYFFGMLGTFIFTRVMSSKGNSIQKQLAQWFGGKQEEEEGKEEQ